MANEIHTSPPDGTVVLGKTLPQLMYEAFERYPNPQAFNQPTGEGEWRAYSSEEFRTQAEEAALGLLDVGLERGDKVALYLESDVYFCLADMGCLIAGLVDVPIYLTHGREQIQYVIDHSEAKALFVSDVERLSEVVPLLGELPAVQTVVVAELDKRAATPELPEGVELLSFEELRDRGRARLKETPGAVEELLEKIDPQDLATLIYTSGTTGQPKGVMLTHENITSNALTTLSCFKEFRSGAGEEVAISFLPLTHIYARTLDYYGFMSQGASVYFCHPDDLSEALQKVQPTIFNSVPRVIEKVYGRIQERTENMEGVQKAIGLWALGLAQQYRMNETPSPLYRLQRALADLIVFKKWRAALGGRVRYLTAGGAALSAELTNIFAAAGIEIVQGYGLTETSPVITFNRPDRNQPGTVGEPIPGVEVRIAEDSEILTRGPHVMKGYYKNQEQTDEVLTEDGWFHTGDIGEFTEEGFLRITDRKKALFKLSTGKYVTPSPLENRLATENLVEQAVVVGSGHKFSAALIFPNEEALRSFARAEGLDAEQPFDQLVEEESVVARFQELVDEANRGMDPWSTIKRFALVPEEPTIENELLTPTMKIRRGKVHERYAEEIEEIYRQAEEEQRRKGQGVIVS